ncbi:MAG: helix-turn-helix transcriptional regulator [Eggerthellales bacterium]|nr:helix-turn-helix transcriptional regulator [Eggerthellales bacterium]
MSTQLVGADEFYLVRAGSRLVAFGVLAVILRPGRQISSPMVIISGAAMVLTMAASLFFTSGIVGLSVALVAGASNGVLMVAWLMAMVEQFRRGVEGFAATMVGALLVSGLVIMVVPRLPVEAFVVVMMLVSVICPFVLAALPKIPGASNQRIQSASQSGTAQLCSASQPGTAQCATLDDSQPVLSAIGTEIAAWFAALMVAICGFVSTILYGAVSRTSWTYGDPMSVPVFLGAAALVVGAAVLGILRSQRALSDLLWAPLLLLTVCDLIVACLAETLSSGVALSLLLAGVFSSHYLRFLVFPAVIAGMRAPSGRAMAITLLVSSGFLGSEVGDMLVSVLPVGFDLRFLSCILCVLLLGAFCVVFAVGRGALVKASRQFRQRAGSPDEAPNLGPGRAHTGITHPSPGSDPCSFEQALIHAGLTPRETEIILLTAQGNSAAFIADQLVISGSTVRFHQQNAYRKLSLHSKQELIQLKARLS